VIYLNTATVFLLKIDFGRRERRLELISRDDTTVLVDMLRLFFSKDALGFMAYKPAINRNELLMDFIPNYVRNSMTDIDN
jgi:hypothetical protein